ncbi:glutamate receptor 2.2-like [Andrographis paniculata]|uniref:glutamate receptor 2.2-like n=1 Tax=Andrographis paniculata TaxID=175694 RepID=UPI0021E94D10|nr:glutamate receptor 2.2-like [Andrographis paniculata]
MQEVCLRMGKKTLILCLILLRIFIEFPASGAQEIPIKVGVVVDMIDDYGEKVLTALSMAVSDFYATHAYYTTRLTLINRNSKGTVVGAAAAAIDLIKNVEVQAIIGPVYSSQASFLISLADVAHVPVVTFSATAPYLSSSPTPYFVRATLNDSSQVDAIGAIVKAFGWREVVPIYEDTGFGEGIVPYLTDALERVNARVPYRSVISTLATDDQIVAELYKLMTMQTRVFVVHMLDPVASRLFTKAKEMDMMSRDYVWIVTDGITYGINAMDPKVVNSMLGVIGVRPYIPSTPELDDFEVRFKTKVRQNNPTNTEPQLDHFILWAYDSVIALAMAAEQAKLTTPKFIETNSSRNFTDLEALGVSDAGPKLIQALSTTTFKGLAGDFNLVDGQLQAPPFQIINIVGPGARGVGYWTNEDGIVKELNNNNPMKDTNSTLQSNFGTIIWPGDSSSPPKGWVIPTNGKKLRVGVPVKSGFTDFVRVTWNPDNSTVVEGFSIEVFDAVMAALPYGVPYEYIPFATPNHKMAGSYNELTYQVYLGKYDAVAGDVTIIADRAQFVDFTLPYTQSGVSMVVPFKDDKISTAWVFLKPLTWELWLASFCSFVFIGFLIWILEHRINDDFRGPFWYQVGMIFWFAFSTMVFAHKERVISNLARFVMIIWFLVVLILTQSYTASLASMLTVQKLTPSVEDVNDLIRSKEPVGYKYGSFVYGLLRKMNFDESRLKPFLTPEEMDELLSKGPDNGGVAAAFHEDPYLKVFLTKYGSKYTMVGPLYKADGFGFVFPKGSPLVPDVSRAILNVTEGPRMADIERKWLGDPTKRPDCNTLSTAPRNLGLGSFWGLFLIVGIAGLIAFVSYVAMFLHEHWHAIEENASVRDKFIELLRIFDKEDPYSYTIRKERASCPSCQVQLTPTSRYASTFPSPGFSSPRGTNDDELISPKHPTNQQTE